MKIFRLAFCFILSSLGLTSALGAVLWIQNPEKDLGDVDIEMQDSIYWTYEFKNLSKSPAVFTKADVGCGCSRIIYPKDTIPGGAHGFITVVLGIKDQKGKFEKYFSLFDHNGEFYVMTLSGNAIIKE